MAATIIRSAISGIVAFLMVSVMAVSLSYIKCLILGVAYNFSMSTAIALKGGLVIGVIIFVLVFISSRRKARDGS